jgi:hypothetical protein
MNGQGGSMPNLSDICNALESMVHAASADALGTPDLAVGGSVVVKMPAWVWAEAKIDMGRKSFTADGSPALMPVRIDWETGSVFVAESGKTVNLPWRIVGLGHDTRGVARVHVSADMGVRAEGLPGEGLTFSADAFFNARKMHAFLRGVVVAGKNGRWSLIDGLENYTSYRLSIANYAVAHELRGDRDAGFSAVLDDIALDALVSELLFGDGASSVVTRMIDRALEPTKFQKVDPLRYFAIAIRARAEEAIRRQIGDPKVGPKVRRILAVSGATTLDELLAAYRSAFPKDSLAHKRAVAALTAGPEVSAHQVLFKDEVSGASAL